MPSQSENLLSLGQMATLAVIMEATAPKPGNVHRGADFEDVTYPDFLAAAVAIGPAMDRAASEPVGQTVLAAVQATRALVGSNTNLGTVLLLAPLAKATAIAGDLRDDVRRVLGQLTSRDASDVYEAIRLAQPGGLGKVAEADVAQAAPPDLIAAMQLASDRDLVARQFVNGFEQVFEVVLLWLQESLAKGWSLSQCIVHLHVRLMSEYPDSLIARKCGMAVAEQSARRAAAVLEAGAPGDEDYERALGDLDFWLRSDYHRRNPGTTADLIAAGLFAALRLGIIQAPFRIA